MTVNTEQSPPPRQAGPHAPRTPRIPPVPRLAQDVALARPCEGFGAPAGVPCTPLSMCEGD
ncbi:hypothetical protein [Streptomyces sp. YIM S03343]